MKTQELQTFAGRFAAVRAISPESIIERNARPQHDLTEVREGGVIRLRERTYRVTGTATVTATDKSFKTRKNYVVTELVLICLEDGQVYYIEWVKDDGVEISFTEKKLSRQEIAALQYDDGAAFDLADLDEVIDEEWELVLRGTTYDYDDDWPAVYESSDGRKANVQIAEFGSDRVGWLSIEGWVDEDGGKPEYDVYLSSNVNPAEIEIIAVG